MVAQITKTKTVSVTSIGVLAAVSALVCGLCFPNLSHFQAALRELVRSVTMTALALSPLIMIGWSAVLVAQQVKRR